MPIDAARWQRLSPWLDQVLEQPTGEREGWLDALALREPELAAELRALLAGGTAAKAAQVAQVARALQDLAPAMAAQPLAGRRIGAYTLLEPLGEGGMGSVWLAERHDGRFEGRAAIKLLHAGLVQRALAERFRREGAILARLAHPHIARLVDAGLTEDGQPYLVLEHVAGERIDRWCDAKRLDLRARLVVFAQVLQAVQHAHSQLVVHRDLKPANVMVDAAGEVKLLDFGIAKLLDDGAALAEATELTRDGGRVLTPLYAAPEQLHGATATTATDGYALGLLLYVLLTGQHPRVDAEGQPITSAATTPLASRVVADSTRRRADDLSAAAAVRGTTPARLARQLAGDLDNILAKALRDEPAERYATVAAFADDLQRHLEGHTVSARPDSLAYRVSRFVGRHKLGVGLAGAALAAIVGLAVVADQQRRGAERERDQTARAHAASQAVAIFMEEQLGQVGEGGDRAVQIDRAQRRAQQLFFDTPEVLFRLHQHFYVLNFQLGRDREMRRNAEVVREAAQRIDDPVTRAEATCLGGARSGTPQAAVSLIEETLEALPHSTRTGSVRWICWFEKGELLFAAGRFEEAGAAYEAARQSAPELFARLRQIPNTRARASVLDRLGQPFAADQAYAEAGRLYEEAGRGHSLAMANNLMIRSGLHSRFGRPRESLALVEQATQMARELGGGQAMLDTFAMRMAFEYIQLDRPADALRLYAAALERSGRLQPLNPRFWNPVAWLHHLRGESAKAIEVLERSVAANRADGLGYYVTFALLGLAEVHLRQGEFERALQALDALDATSGAAGMRYESRKLRARAWNLGARPVEAEVAARDAIAEAQRRLPNGMRSTLHGNAYLELARALAAQGRASEARSAAERAAAELDDAVGPQHSATRAAVALARP